MSEHRSPSPRVIPLPRPVQVYDEAAEEAEFVTRILPELALHARNRHEHMQFGRCSVAWLLQSVEEAYQDLTLLLSGLGPEHRDQLIEQLAPQWARFSALIARNHELALAARAQGD